MNRFHVNAQRQAKKNHDKNAPTRRPPCFLIHPCRRDNRRYVHCSARRSAKPRRRPVRRRLSAGRGWRSSTTERRREPEHASRGSRLSQRGGPLWWRVGRLIPHTPIFRDGILTVLPLDAALPVHGSNDILTAATNARDAQARLILTLLLGRGANPNVTEPSDIPPCLYRAVRNSDDASAKILLDGGASPDKAGVPALPELDVTGDEVTVCETYYGSISDESSLVNAAHRCDAPMVALLLAHHASPNAQDSQGATALHYASDYRYAPRRHAKIVRALLSAGANPSVKTTKLFNGTPATPADIADWSYNKMGGANRIVVVANKKNRHDYEETLRLLEEAEARQKREAKK